MPGIAAARPGSQPSSLPPEPLSIPTRPELTSFFTPLTDEKSEVQRGEATYQSQPPKHSPLWSWAFVSPSPAKVPTGEYPGPAGPGLGGQRH